MNEWLVLGEADLDDLRRAGRPSQGSHPGVVRVATLNQALEVADDMRPPVIVLRVSMAELISTDALHVLHGLLPDCRLVVVTGVKAVGGAADTAADSAEVVGTCRLEADPTSAGQARREVGRVCAAVDECFLDGDAKLVATELVSNAVRHGGTPFSFKVSAVAGAVRIDVEDLLCDMPRPRLASDDDFGGRGLVLVDALSVAWGIDPSADGKTVWAHLERAPALGH